MNAFVLHLRDQKVGGAVTSGQLYRVFTHWDVLWDDRVSEFTTATRGQRLVVLLHGYNNDREEGRERLVGFIHMLKQKGSTDPMLAVLWPGDAWTGVFSYPSESRDADDSAEALVKWLLGNVDQTARIALVGHSLGCRVVMNAAQKLVRFSQGKKPTLDRICLMAAAIDNDCLGKLDTTCYRDATLAADRTAVLASEQDLVLRFAYPAGDLMQTILFRGERAGWALGRTGPDEQAPEVLAKIEPLKADPSRNVGHGDYLDVDPRTPGQTKAESERFVFEFLNRLPQPKWPAA